jgi:activating signal cointegrator 1
MALKCITLYEPYCSLIAVGAKTTETRSWGTHHRGWLAIHASRRWTKAIVADCLRSLDILKASGFSGPLPAQDSIGLVDFSRTLGCVLAVARLVDCRTMMEAPDSLNAAFGMFGEGRYGWVLRDVVPLPNPVPAKGAMGLWSLPPEVEEAVLVEAGMSAGVV